MAVVFSGAGGSGSSQTTRPADPGRPPWHTDYGSADAIVCLKTYLIKIWAPAHDVPLHADELAAFSMSSLTTSFMEYAAEHGVEELLRDGLNLTQGWMLAQLSTKQEWTCVVNLHAPDLAEHGGIARLFTMEPDDILHVAQTAVDAYGQCSCDLLFSEGHGHHIVLEGFDPADRTFVYWDPWPGLTLLSRYADDSEVWHATELVRHWKVTWSALSRLLYGIRIPTWCWDELHGRRSARPAPPAGPALPTRPVTSIDDLTDSQIRKLLDFVALCDQSGCLSDRVLLAFGLAAADGLLFAAADGGTTLLQLLVGMVEAGSARGWNLEPDVLRTLILSTEPSIAHQNAYPPAKTITDSDVMGYVLRLLGTWSDRAGDTSGARRWLTRAAAVSRGWPGAAASYDLGCLEEQAGNTEDAERWLLQAAGSGHPSATPAAQVRLGHLTMNMGREAEARQWFEHAVTAGEQTSRTAAGLVGLALLALRADDRQGAIRWLHRAFKTEDPRQSGLAAAMIGAILDEGPDPRRARPWFERAAVSAHHDAAGLAAAWLADEDLAAGRFQTARRWLSLIIDAGDPGRVASAMLSLGRIDRDDGRTREARAWFEAAAASDDTEVEVSAMNALAALSRDDGDEAEEAFWLGRATAAGGPKAAWTMLHIGGRHLMAGEFDQARTWLDKARLHGDTVARSRAMILLGIVEEEQHRLREAMSWYEQAAVTGEEQDAAEARQRLEKLQRQQEEKRNLAAFHAARRAERKTGGTTMS